MLLDHSIDSAGNELDQGFKKADEFAEKRYLSEGWKSWVKGLWEIDHDRYEVRLGCDGLSFRLDITKSSMSYSDLCV